LRTSLADWLELAVDEVAAAHTNDLGIATRDLS
jgi:hypothetical protein